jgi:hypothetical protein
MLQRCHGPSVGLSHMEETVSDNEIHHPTLMLTNGDCVTPAEACCRFMDFWCLSHALTPGQ